MEKLEKLKELVASLDGNADKFHNKGVASAGSKVRKTLQEIKVLAQEWRVEIQDSKNSKKGK